LLFSIERIFTVPTSRLLAHAAGLAVAVCAPVLALAADKPAPGTAASGLPIPRFVSLKSDRVNMRNGPSTEYPTSWVYKRAGLPLEVIKEYEGWREVRDADGATGWVLQSFLSGRRTALVLPWEVKPDKPVPRVALKAGDSSGSASLAEMEAGVIANLLSCDRKWCHVTIGDYRGYLEQKQLWGVYPDEVLK
jgi:SH3-like domain-containing protein